MEIRVGSVGFSLPMRGNGPRTSSQTEVLPSQLTSAASSLSADNQEFSGGSLCIGETGVSLQLALTRLDMDCETGQICGTINTAAHTWL